MLSALLICCFNQELMSISKDILWKGIIENLVDDFIWYFFPNYVEKIDFERGFEFLDTELQKLIPDNPGQNRHADKLIRVWLKDGLEAWFLIHVEVQGYQDIQFAARMFEYMYRIRDKYQQPVTGLAIYTDWNRRYHYTQFTETFLGTEVIYRFNTYVLRDHTPEILAQDANPFAAVMEAAWQQLGKKKTDDQLYSTKLDLIKRLLKRKVSRKKIVSIINFIKYFVPFTNSENLLKFEQDLNQLIKADQPMGIEEAILEEIKQQGIELGETKFKEELLKHAVPELAQLGLEAEKIAAILDLDLDAVRKVMEEGMQE
ncbi:hypothetical protein [Haliscomenobacter hydrossis]|uniref:Transposase (putative) YhgA-like domain-containing protein n=1 Tax=Haliscomenobacter hydrossis (strain ATCC 27775 / DSM 1100 / LMG 10767 / O) TaxID=760192 RepID=F4L405_HALH1|nr:hypothetical protein [Haliscomenobacter hydrossis]AEE49722.1 hypothetical protein Halhy_1837 [Haliscomenobacter hydrossis DSM 1100]